jgi:hypothetical protein
MEPWLVTLDSGVVTIEVVLHQVVLFIREKDIPAKATSHFSFTLSISQHSPFGLGGNDKASLPTCVKLS